MVKCKNCNTEMVFRPLDDKNVILVCPKEDCDFRSTRIPIDSSYKLTEIGEQKIINKNNDNIPIKETIKEKESHKIEAISLRDKERVITKCENITAFPRKGKLNEFSIYCVDFSSRMEIEIPYKKSDLKVYKNKLSNDQFLSEDIKAKLLELIEPPISYMRAINFSFSLLILKNIKEMTYKDFQSFQILSMAETSEEIFRFPNFKAETSQDIITEFINTFKIRRKEYESNAKTEFRDYSEAIELISESLIEFRESYPNQMIEIFFITIGLDKTPHKSYLNPIRKIKILMEELKPFKFNIFNLNGRSIESFLRQICQNFEGTYSKENTFKDLIQSIAKSPFSTDTSVSPKIQDLKPSNKKFIGDIEEAETHKTQKEEISKDKTMKIEEIDSINIQDSSKKEEKEEMMHSLDDVEIITPKRKADDILDNLKEKL
jgi:hypothetical protein